MNEDKTPFVPMEIVKHLKETYTTNVLLDVAVKLPNADQALGSMIGITQVIDYLQSLADGED